MLVNESWIITTILLLLVVKSKLLRYLTMWFLGNASDKDISRAPNLVKTANKAVSLNVQR
jgi:hypothetical protein